MRKPAAPKPDPRERQRRAYDTTYEIRRAVTWTDHYMLLADGSVIAGPGDYASILDSFETLTAEPAGPDYLRTENGDSLSIPSAGACECDNTHRANGTVCRPCWQRLGLSGMDPDGEPFKAVVASHWNA